MRLSLALVCLAVLALAACAPSSPTPSRGGQSETSAPATPSVAATGQVSAPGTGASATTDFSADARWPSLRLVPRWSGLDQPISLAIPATDPSHVLIAQKGGVVRSVRGGKVERGAFLDISGKVSTGGEQGLLSIAFPPGPASAERVYAYYTDATGDVVISRFRLRSSGAADAGSEQEVLRVPHRQFANHNGGGMLFGPDGLLYLGVGDGGGSGDTLGNGQNLGSLLAKLLRIDVEGLTAAGSGVPRTYLVPPANPFVKRAGARPETFLWGLRNPWRFSFDAATADLYIGDVGQDAWEEIDFLPSGSRGGENLGWSRWEGLHPFPPDASRSRDGYTFPVAEYGHDLGNAVVGGYVYRGRRSPAMQGVYFFGDDGSGRIWALRRAGGRWQMRELTKTSLAISSFGEDADRELYVLDLAGGTVYQLTAE